MTETTETNSSKFGALKRALAQISKSYSGQTALFSDFIFPPVERIPIPYPQVNYALGGGLPVGKIIEVFGPESGGKSLLSAISTAEFQKAGKLCAWVDLERSFSPEFYRAYGLVPEDLVISTPEGAEDCLNIVTALVKSGTLGLIVVDSVAAMVTNEQVEKEAGEATMASLARVMSPALAKLVPLCDDAGTTIIFINQIREKVGVMFGNPEDTPGGRALKFYSSVRLKLGRKGGSELKDSKTKDPIGHTVKLKVEKNKTASPGRSCEYVVYYDGRETSLDQRLALALELGEKLDLISREGNTYTWSTKSGVEYRGIKSKLLLALAEAPEEHIQEFVSIGC